MEHDKEPAKNPRDQPAGNPGGAARYPTIGAETGGLVMPHMPSDGYCRAAWLAVCRSQAVAEFDAAGIVTWANDSFLALMGYRLGDLVGRHHRKLCFDAHAAAPAYTVFWEKLARGEFDRGEYARRRSDGSEVWLQATYNPVFDNEGAVWRVLKVATDVTRQVVLERQVQAHLAEAKLLQRALEDRGSDLERSVAGLATDARFVSDLADQIGMLALNASIEAARAGEAGRGFGAVAAMITRLAADTRAATDRSASTAAAHG